MCAKKDITWLSSFVLSLEVSHIKKRKQKKENKGTWEVSWGAVSVIEIDLSTPSRTNFLKILKVCIASLFVQLHETF